MNDELDWQDIRQVESAEGWLGLGDTKEANRELGQIAAGKQLHPAVLQVRYLICAKEQLWEACVKFAEAMVRKEPTLAFGWIHRSYALHELKRTREALDQLLPAVKHFPQEATVRYNLACYECVLGNLDQAKRRLTETFKIAAAEKCLEEYRRTAAGDTDLKPLWGALNTLHQPKSV